MSIAKTHWKHLIILNEKIKEINDFSFTEYAGSYGFYAKGIEQFDEFMKQIKASYIDKYKEKMLKEFRVYWS